MSNILVIGAGGVSSVTVQKMATLPNIFHKITLASRTIKKCKEIQVNLKKKYNVDIHIVELDADNVMWNVDMCQFRHSRELIESLTSRGVSVMITGSKFYQAPPFCGAILIPERWINKIEKLNELRHFNLFNKVFSRYDIPEKLRSKTNLPSEINKGGVCRWLVTIKSIYDLRRIGQGNIQKVISNWNSFKVKEEGVSREDSDGSFIRIELEMNRKGGGGLQRVFWLILNYNLLKI